jgi:hypothetical protein
MTNLQVVCSALASDVLRIAKIIHRQTHIKALAQRHGECLACLDRDEVVFLSFPENPQFVEVLEPFDFHVEIQNQKFLINTAEFLNSAKKASQLAFDGTVDLVVSVSDESNFITLTCALSE